MISFASLAVFSGLSLNLLIQFALGAAGAAGDTPYTGRRVLPLFQFGTMFISVLLLWVVFARIFPVFWMGFSEYFLFFPLSALVCIIFEFSGERVLKKIVPRFNPKYPGIRRVFSALTAYDGLVLVSLIITIGLSGSFADAVVLSLFFALGNLIAMLILNEIHRKSTLEQVPRFLRGSPLILVSMGLLSLISASLAGVFFKILEVF